MHGRTADDLTSSRITAVDDDGVLTCKDSLVRHDDIITIYGLNHSNNDCLRVPVASARWHLVTHLTGEPIKTQPQALEPMASHPYMSY